MTPRPLVERVAAGADPADVPLAERIAAFRAEARDPDWRRRAIRCALGLDDPAELAKCFEAVLSDLEHLLALPEEIADREAAAGWERHREAAASYCATMTRRLGWLVRSGAPEAAVEGAAADVDRRFGSLLAPGDLARIALHSGKGEAERRAADWRRAVAALTAHARRQRTGGGHGQAA